MARGCIEVTYQSRDETRIPDALTEGAALLLDLRQRGVLTAIGEKLRIRRQGGYCGLDAWLVLLLFFTANTGRGFREFWESSLRPHVQQLAALAGRRRLPASASLSRALDAVETDLVRPASSWLLTGMAAVDELLSHPAVQTYDARGEGWHVFDLDPTVTTLRQRALPADDDLPEPRRRSADTGAPGHAGRKRGDLQFRRVTVQHSGASVWVHAHLSPGNGEGVLDFERALDTVVETRDRLGHPPERAFVRMDGEYGYVPFFTACRERALPFVTRLNRPKLYEDPEVLDRLRSATWSRVPDSRSGPRRVATDLGVLTVRPGDQTRRPDGSRYDAVRVRVVASAFPKEGSAKRGRVLDGYQVELFAVDLPADAWPAADAVAAYFGRIAQENRFAQEDHELGLDRILSYHLPGQELATLVGLGLWNLRLARGFAMDPPPTERPAQADRGPRPEAQMPEHWPRDPVVRDLLGQLDWAAMLKRRPAWRWDAVSGELVCPDGRGLRLTTVRSGASAEGRSGVVFRRPRGGCEDCAPREGCLESSRNLASKHAELSIPTSAADELRERLVLTRGRASRPRTIETIRSRPGPREVLDALFLPARARRLYTDSFREATLHVRVEIPPPARSRPHLVAVDVADRQRRRKTWTQNVDRYAMPGGTRVRLKVEARPALRQMLGEPLRACQGAATAG